MAIKEIISVDVADESFKRFLELFEKYKADVTELPEAWQKVDDAATSAGGAMGGMAASSSDTIVAMGAATGAMAEALHNATTAQRHFESATRGSHRAMKGLGEASEKVASTIFGIGKWVLKFGAIGAGLAGLAGGFAMDELADAAVSRQRSALGVGMKPGQQAAFNTYMSQFGVGQNVESGVANIRSDVTKRWALSAMGITPTKGESNFALDQAAVKAAYQFANATPAADLAPLAKARGFTEAGFSIDTLRQFRATPYSQVEAAMKGAQSSTNALGFSSATARDWTQFSIALHRAGIEIESSLIVGLRRLTPELSTISHRVSDWIAAFAKGPQMGEWVKGAENGLKTFATFLGSAKFQSDMRAFATDVGALAHETVVALRYLHLIPQKEPSFDALKKAAAQPNQITPVMDIVQASLRRHLAGDYTNAHIAKLSAADDKKYGLPAGTMQRLADHESSDGKHLFGPETKYGRAVGVWQMLHGTAKEMHVAYRMNAKEEGEGAAHYLAILHKHYGSWKKAVAAYNWGPGNVDADIKKHGKKWLDYAPGQTKGEVAAVVGNQSPTSHRQPQMAATAHAALPASVDRLVTALRKQQQQQPKSIKISLRTATAARLPLQANGAAY